MIDNRKIQVSPSILSADFARLGEQVREAVVAVPGALPRRRNGTLRRRPIAASAPSVLKLNGVFGLP